jgi:tetratricopeptide (TPR) repeat protein
MERSLLGQNEVNAIIPILKFAENDGSSPHKFVTAADLDPVLHDPEIDAASCIPQATLSAPLPASHPDAVVAALLSDVVPAVDALVAEGARASTTGQWRRDLVLQVSKGLRAASAALDDGAPQRGACEQLFRLRQPTLLSAGCHVLEVGDRVFVFGLVNRAELNGCVGEVLQAAQDDALLKSGDGRVAVMMKCGKGKAKESVRIKPENLRLYSRKIASDRAVLPGVRCVIRHHSKQHHCLVVDVVSFDPRTDSVSVRAVCSGPHQAPFFVMAHNVVPLSLHALARRTFAAIVKLIPELRQLDTDLGAAVSTCLKSCGLFAARCCRPDVTANMIKLALQNYYVSYLFETHALSKARKYDWFFEYSLIAVNHVTGYLEQHDFHEPAHDVHVISKTTFEERNLHSMNVAMSYMNIGVMCYRMRRFDHAEQSLLKAQKFLHEHALHETGEASKVLWSLGVCYSLQESKWAQGEQLLKDSLRMKLKRGGRGALDATLPMDSLITLYLKQNRLKEAEILCKEMWRLRQSVLSPYTALYPEALFRIAQLYERRNLLTHSEMVCKEALRLRELHFGWESLAVAESLLLIALLRARAMRFDESELLLREVLRIAPLFSSSGGGRGVPGLEMIGAVALQAHIHILRGDSDRAFTLHMEALDMKVALCQSSIQPHILFATKACTSNLASVWSQASSGAGAIQFPPLPPNMSFTPSSLWSYPGARIARPNPLLSAMCSLPDLCAPEVLAKWVVHSDLLEARGYVNRRIHEPQNAAAAAWAAAAVAEEQPQLQEAVSENVIDFFIDRAIERGQLQSVPSDCAHDARLQSPSHHASQQASPCAADGAAAAGSSYGEILRAGCRDVIDLYANTGELKAGSGFASNTREP